ncbi:MAG: hypothetical protein R3F62_08860 [Planctomycetota bacterium]
MSRWSSLVWVWVACALTATAGGFSGRWQVAQGFDRGARRGLVEREGELALIGPPEIPGLAGRVLRGPYQGDRAELDAEAQRGAVQLLEGGEVQGGAFRVSLTLRRRGEAREVVARYLADGRLVAQELWVQAREPLVEVLEVLAPADYDPKEHGPLRVRWRLRGKESRRARLRVELPDEDGGRYTHYYEALGGGSAPLTVVTEDLGAVAPGEHVLELSGRDQTKAKRILLSGGYRVVLELPEVEEELGRDEAGFSVARARAEHLAPQWLYRKGTDLIGDERWMPSADASQIQRDLAKGLTGLAGRTPPIETRRLTPEQFATRMARAADVVIKTHGNEQGVGTYVSTDPKEVIEVKAHVGYVDEASLRRALPRGDELKDLHVVFVWACLAGKSTLPQTLVARGADVVVAFDQEIAAGASNAYFTRLFADLSGRRGSAVPPADAVRSWGWAAREAAVFADAGYAKELERIGYDPQAIEDFRHRLRDSIVIKTAPGIDADKEKGYPVRYGNSTN